jgi:hypothetical protein
VAIGTDHFAFVDLFLDLLQRDPVAQSHPEIELLFALNMIKLHHVRRIGFAAIAAGDALSLIKILTILNTSYPVGRFCPGNHRQLVLLVMTPRSFSPVFDVLVRHLDSFRDKSKGPEAFSSLGSFFVAGARFELATSRL